MKKTTFTSSFGPQMARSKLLQFRVLCLGFFQNGNFGVGIFPEGEEVLVGGEGLLLVALEDIGAGKAQLRHGEYWIGGKSWTQGKHFLKLSSSVNSLA